MEEQLETANLKLSENETSIKILKRIKNAYKQALEIGPDLKSAFI